MGELMCDVNSKRSISCDGLTCLFNDNGKCRKASIAIKDLDVSETRDEMICTSYLNDVEWYERNGAALKSRKFNEDKVIALTKPAVALAVSVLVQAAKDVVGDDLTCVFIWNQHGTYEVETMNETIAILPKEV